MFAGGRGRVLLTGTIYTARDAGHKRLTGYFPRRKLPPARMRLSLCGTGPAGREKLSVCRTHYFLSHGPLYSFVTRTWSERMIGKVYSQKYYA